MYPDVRATTRLPLADFASVTCMGEIQLLEEVRGDDPELASYLRIGERELEAGGLN